MKYVNVFNTELEFNNISSNLAKPLLALAGNALYCLDDIIIPEDEMVDLGLNVKWAKYNIGATHGSTVESWYGNYYAWGETSVKTDYSWSTYELSDDGGTTMSKYNASDGSTTLDSADDAAYVVKSLRMPIDDEISELLTLDHEWVSSYNEIVGLSGMVITGTNGNSIFIPAAGFYDGTTLTNAGTGCGIWSRTVCTSGYRSAYIGLLLNDGSELLYDAGRYGGFSIRAVCKK